MYIFVHFSVLFLFCRFSIRINLVFLLHTLRLYNRYVCLFYIDLINRRTHTTIVLEIRSVHCAAHFNNRLCTIRMYTTLRVCSFYTRKQVYRTWPRAMVVSGPEVNPPPGNIIDNLVTRPNAFDLFAVNQRLRLRIMNNNGI